MYPSKGKLSPVRGEGGISKVVLIPIFALMIDVLAACTRSFGGPCWAMHFSYGYGRRINRVMATLLCLCARVERREGVVLKKRLRDSEGVRGIYKVGHRNNRAFYWLVEKGYLEEAWRDGKGVRYRLGSLGWVYVEKYEAELTRRLADMGIEVIFK